MIIGTSTADYEITEDFGGFAEFTKALPDRVAGVDRDWNEFLATTAAFDRAIYTIFQKR